MARDLARELYRAYRTQARRHRAGDVINESREKTRDPHSFADSLQELVANRDWRQGIAEGTLFSDWKIIVGDEIATHTTPISILDGVLLIQCSSTAWATQLNLISNDVLASLQASAPGALVEKLSIIGPQGPSWKRGIRTIRGARGPRDTFG